MPVTAPPRADALTDLLVRPGSLWSHVEVVASSASTNADLATLARSGAAHGSVLVTDNQTAGRGRFTRAWTAPPGVSIAMSVLVRPEVSPRRWSWLPLMTGVAVVRGVKTVSGLAATLKWPNDVVVADRKLCGLLAERVDTSTGPAAVIGCGINVSMDAGDLPVPTATSLRLEGAEVDKTTLVAGVLEAFAPAYASWVDDPAGLRAAYEAECGTLGREVRVMRDAARGAEGDLVEGTAVGVDDDGRLVVRTAGGTESFSAGDVLHLRPR